MKVYILLQKYYGYVVTEYRTSASVLGVFNDSQKALKMLKELVKDDIDDDCELDKDTQNLDYGFARVYYGCDNYYELEIIESEIK